MRSAIPLELVSHSRRQRSNRPRESTTSHLTFARVTHTMASPSALALISSLSNREQGATVLSQLQPSAWGCLRGRDL